ncbi:hypothetical protein [Bernardetia sp. MNP-M8]|uniref:hypothetical protein n=1 Tax=Bernardetia sp. MNP-M8 TaxID=3127470 RepID=UPI0030D16F3D
MTNYNKIEQTDNIDILLTLNSHGWSSCFLFIRNKTFEFTITHVFSEPYLDLIQALSNLINGQKDITFYWYGEPGGCRFEINKIMTQQDKVIVSINEFGESFYEEPKKYDLMVTFEIKVKQLISIFYFQLQKTHFLLQDKQFSENRQKDFPFQEFHKFEKTVKQFLNL